MLTPVILYSKEASSLHNIFYNGWFVIRVPL